jgi:hypothetical protein
VAIDEMSSQYSKAGIQPALQCGDIGGIKRCAAGRIHFVLQRAEFGLWRCADLLFLLLQLTQLIFLALNLRRTRRNSGHINGWCPINSDGYFRKIRDRWFALVLLLLREAFPLLGQLAVAVDQNALRASLFVQSIDLFLQLRDLVIKPAQIQP